MAVSTTELSKVYEGNNSNSEPYPIPFPFLETAHIKASRETHALLGQGFPRAEVFVPMTAFQFPLMRNLSQSEPAPGDVIRARRPGGTSYTRTYRVVDASHLGEDVWLLTLNSPEAAKLGGGDNAAGDEDTIFRVTETALFSPSQYTVTRLPGGAGGSVVTAEALASSQRLIVRREVPLTQPTILQAAGPFPAKANEAALDRLLMQIQQVHRRIQDLEAQTDPDPFITPGGQPEATRHVQAWAGPSQRSNAQPAWAGQLGVEIETQTIWIAQSTSAGDWKRFGEWQKEYVVFHGNQDVASVENLWLGTLSETTAVKSIHVGFGDALTDQVSVAVSTDTLPLGEVTVEAGETFGSVPCVVPFELLPPGTPILVTVENSGYTTTQGLSVVLTCRYF